MARKHGTYIGGHTTLTQRRADFEATLARDAARTNTRKRREQIEFDRELERQAKAHDEAIRRLESDYEEAARLRKQRYLARHRPRLPQDAKLGKP